MIRLGLLGASGRMGERVLAEAESFADRLRIEARPGRGDDLGPLAGCDAVLDFSSPAYVLEALARIGPSNPEIVWVVGSTGWTPEQENELAGFGRLSRILRASNFSLGVLATAELLSRVSEIPLFSEFSARIRETHHVHKKDAPSGTALTLRERLGPQVAIESVREGEVIGTHEVIFEGVGERITVTHEAQDRALFARGALASVVRLREKRASFAPRIISMRELWL